MESMLDLLLILLVIAALYAIPIVFRAFLHWVQVLPLLGVIIYVVKPHTTGENPDGILFLLLIWLLGCTSALSLRIRDRGDEMKREHEAEYHYHRRDGSGSA